MAARASRCFVAAFLLRLRRAGPASRRSISGRAALFYRPGEGSSWRTGRRSASLHAACPISSALVIAVGDRRAGAWPARGAPCWARRRARRLSAAGAGARAGARRQHPVQGSLGPRAAGADHGIRRRQAVHPGLRAERPVPTQLLLPGGRSGDRVLPGRGRGSWRAPRRRRRARRAARSALGSRRSASSASPKAGISSRTWSLRGFLVFATTWLLYRWIVRRATGSRRSARARAPSRRRAAALLRCWPRHRGCGDAGVYRLARPAARRAFPRRRDRDRRSVFRFITSSASRPAISSSPRSLALGVRALAARRTPESGAAQLSGAARAARRLRLRRGRGAGLVGDILKPVFGRARPKLWLRRRHLRLHLAWRPRGLLVVPLGPRHHHRRARRRAGA